MKSEVFSGLELVARFLVISVFLYLFFEFELVKLQINKPRIPSPEKPEARRGSSSRLGRETLKQ